MQKKKRRRRSDMERLLARRARHGLTFRELSEQSGIPIPTLSYWASKVRREEGGARAGLVEVEILDEPSSGAIAVESRSGLRVTVERGFDSEHLVRVLSALARC